MKGRATNVALVLALASALLAATNGQVRESRGLPRARCAGASTDGGWCGKRGIGSRATAGRNLYELALPLRPERPILLSRASVVIVWWEALHAFPFATAKEAT